MTTPLKLGISTIESDHDTFNWLQFWPNSFRQMINDEYKEAELRAKNEIALNLKIKIVVRLHFNSCHLGFSRYQFSFSDNGKNNVIAIVMSGLKRIIYAGIGTFFHFLFFLNFGRSPLQ